MRFTLSSLFSISHIEFRFSFRSIWVKQCDTCSKVNQSLGNSIGHLSVYAMKFPRLCSDRSPLDPYNHHIRLNDVPHNKNPSSTRHS